MEATYKIPAGNILDLESRIAKLNKRAIKLGVPPIVMVKAPEQVEKFTDKSGVERVNHFYMVTVSGEAPKMNGWKFLATLSPVELEDKTVEMLALIVPGETIPAQYHKSDLSCDHCGQKRYRTEVFVVSHEDGRFAQVGRQCLKDFLGHSDPHRLADWATLLMSLDADIQSEYCGFRGKPVPPSLLSFLKITAYMIRRLGWVSRSRAQLSYGAVEATVNRVWWYMDPKITDDSVQAFRKFVNEHGEPTEDDEVEAQKAADWAKSLEGKNDYEQNISLISRSAVVPQRAGGFAASIVSSYQRHLGYLQDQERKAKVGNNSQHVGAVGNKIEFVGSIEGLKSVENDWGHSTFVRMTDENGNILTWFASGYPTIEIRKVYKIRGTVKKHDEFKGTKQTVLTRCKLTPIN